MKKQYLLVTALIIFILGFANIAMALTCESPLVGYNGACTDPIPPCKTPIANSTSCIDKIENGQYIEHYSFSCLSGYTKSGEKCVAGGNTTSGTSLQILDTHISSGSIAFDVKDVNLTEGDQYFMECTEVGNEQYGNNPRQLRQQIANNPSTYIQMMVSVKSGTQYDCYVAVQKTNGQVTRHSEIKRLTASSTTTSCTSPFILYNNKCTDPIPPCKTPIANSTSCIDKIENGQYIEHYSFSCLPGYEKTSNACIGSIKCTVPLVEYQGKCVDPIPPCASWPSNAVVCIDKIENGQRISRYNFQCIEGFVRSGDSCVAKNTYQPSQTSTTQMPPAGYEDEVIVNTESYQNPFPDTNTAYDEGKAAAELYRRGVIGGYPDGEFKGAREVNRAEAAKFLLLAKLGTVEDLQNTGRFPDVVEGQWYVKFIIKSANLGVIEGHPDGNFRPQNTVNTAEFLKMLTKMFGLEEGLNYTYTDVNSSDWFAKYAGVAQKYSLFPNRSTKLEPAKNMTRDEVAVAIYQYLKNR